MNESEIQIISNFCITLYTIKSITLKKSCDVMLFKLQWHIEKYLKELGFKELDLAQFHH